MLDRAQLFRVLELQLDSKKVVELLRAYYGSTVGRMRGGETKFELGSGVRQGAEETPPCFNLFFDYVLAVVERDVLAELAASISSTTFWLNRILGH